MPDKYNTYIIQLKLLNNCATTDVKDGNPPRKLSEYYPHRPQLLFQDGIRRSEKKFLIHFPIPKKHFKYKQSSPLKLYC